jgi:hypothetical protein
MWFSAKFDGQTSILYIPIFKPLPAVDFAGEEQVEPLGQCLHFFGCLTSSRVTAYQQRMSPYFYHCHLLLLHHPLSQQY